MQIGVDSFVAVSPDPVTGRAATAQERISDLLQEIELADRVGLDAFGTHKDHPAELRGDGAERGRSGAGLSGVRDA